MEKLDGENSDGENSDDVKKNEELVYTKLEKVSEETKNEEVVAKNEDEEEMEYLLADLQANTKDFPYGSQDCGS